MIETYQDLQSFREVLETSFGENFNAAERSNSEHQADRMDAVTRFIDDVARRLQLLALNGNIIAAQAGDHGRAFRVVCRELSILADQSKDAVADVRRLSEEMGLRRPAELGLEGSEYPDETSADHAQEP
jgi:methyl-accepting chemotaxis protein